ncbi:hypothetical protein [Gordonia insulae]|uniref:Uncharacterized protein n=1 Tax=Gordonia insulae TaxID=2420509 RepID=A0A3G8JE50_9ACTN|nr:hypothetical protein [Gordonia insulae]AZG43481.1 hypothetical protein D7316_00046 [Gordonia insulae]
MIGLGLHDIAGDHPDFHAEDNEPIDCPWCGGWHSADDDLCPYIPAEPPVDGDIDWADWIGDAA